MISLNFIYLILENFPNHKYNNSWNIEQPIKLVRKQTEMEESQNRNKLISLNNSELKN